MPLVQPTILYPNGNESINKKDVTIIWRGYGANDDFQYELFYTDNYDADKEPDWRQIATVPSNVLSYDWFIPSAVRSNKVRIAIRSRNSHGDVSPYSISANDFSIRRRDIIVPSIISPQSGTSYDKLIEIAIDSSSLIGSYSQRSYMHFYYSSIKAEVPLTTLATDVPINTKRILWNTINLVPSDDYILYVNLSDDDGNYSRLKAIPNIGIDHSGFFVTDTTPPVSSIQIAGGQPFTRNPNVPIRIISYDETTGVHAMQLIEGENISKPETAADFKSFVLSDGDGYKNVELLLQDFGGNRNDDSVYRSFKTILSDDVIGVTYAANVFWAITASDIYQIDSQINSVFHSENALTCIVAFNNQIYVGSSYKNNGSLYRYTGANSVDAVYGFSSGMSVITAMTSHAGYLFIGMINGDIYKYDGATMSIVDSFDNPIGSLASDGSSLLMSQKNDNNIYAFNGTSFVAMEV